VTTVQLPFALEEYEQRLAAVQGALNERQLDAALITRPQNVYYLTGFRSLGAGLAAGMGQIHAALVPASGSPVLFIRSLETKAARRYCWTEVVPYRDHDDAYALIAGRLPPGSQRIGVEYVDMTALQLERFRLAGSAIEVHDVSMLVDRVRRVKSASELAYVDEAARLANLGLEAAISAVRARTRVSDIVAEAGRQMYDAGQDDVNWPPVLVWGGPDGGMMHDTRLDATIDDGDLVTIEVTGEVHLYTADAMGTVCVGPPAAETTTAYDVAVQLHDAAQAALGPGVTASAVHAACDAVFRAAGHGPYMRRVGGAIGINGQPTMFFEGLNLLKGEETPLEAGMTVLVQPGVDTPGMLIVASTNRVTADGRVELTRPLRTLVSR
jgi:Xaa-Pro dipeptidase